jgi:hypothetical protein
LVFLLDLRLLLKYILFLAVMIYTQF